MTYQSYPSASYPVSYDVPRPRQYKRLWVAFRLILAIPQLLLFGGLGGAGYFVFRGGGIRPFFGYFDGGVLSAVLGILVFFAWFAIVFTRRYPSYRDFCLTLFRWSQNVHAYMALLTDPYPPFSGEAPYPVNLQVKPIEEHNRVTVAFRIILVIPHAIVLFFLGLAQNVVTIIAWFAILFTGQFPEPFFTFSVGVNRWSARVLAYLLLFVDEYPPFSLEPDPGRGTAGTQYV